ncbi:MAG: hypothetical protein RIF33_21975 [Cyclobacteriaceae bacterium]
MRDTKLLNTISVVSLLGRGVLFLAIFMLWRLGGFRSDEIMQLALVVTPLTLVLASAFIRYVIEFPYPISTGSHSLRIGLFGTIAPSALYLIYVIMICATALDRSLVSFDALTQFLLIGEGGCAIYCGVFLGRLFDFR